MKSLTNEDFDNGIQIAEINPYINNKSIFTDTYKQMLNKNKEKSKFIWNCSIPRNFDMIYDR